MERVDVFLGLGSNLGEREKNLLKAMNLMDEAFGMHPERISRIVETPAWGFDGQPFLNFCVLYRLPRTGTPEEHAAEILRQVKEVEKALGRNLDEPLLMRSGNRIYHDRIIDIDILCYGAFPSGLMTGPDCPAPAHWGAGFCQKTAPRDIETRDS